MDEGNGPLPRAGDRVTLKQLIQAHIRWWLEETGSIKETAKIVGLHPGALSLKIDKERIAWMKYPRRRNETDESSARHTWASLRPPDHAEGSTDD